MSRTAKSTRRPAAPSPSLPPPPAPPSPEDLARRARRAAIADAITDRWGPEHEPIQVSPISISNLTYRADLRLPAYQRGAVWDFDRACSFLDTALRGASAQPMLFAEHHDGAGYYDEVIDGQQRCLAFGLTLTDPTGAPRAGTTPLLSLSDLRWHRDPAPDRWSIADLCGDRFYTMIDGGADRAQALTASIINRRASHYRWPLIRIPRRTPPDVVRAIFRAHNVQGAPFDLVELDALLATYPTT